MAPLFWLARALSNSVDRSLGEMGSFSNSGQVDLSDFRFEIENTYVQFHSLLDRITSYQKKNYDH